MEKQECIDDFEQKKLVLSDEKCKNCECIEKCKFYGWAMDDMINSGNCCLA